MKTKLNPVFVDIFKDMDNLHSQIEFPDHHISIYEDFDHLHIFSIYDGGKIKYRLVFNSLSSDVLTFKYDKNGDLLPDVIASSSLFQDLPVYHKLNARL